MGSSSEQYCLRWNDFQSNITGAFSDIRDDEDFLDVTLVCDGQTIKAHKLVLSACSPLFRTMLKKNGHPQPMIFLHGVRFVDISAILNFMYHGEVNVNQDDLQTFLNAAEELRIRGLSDRSGTQDPGGGLGDSSRLSSPPKSKRVRRYSHDDIASKRGYLKPSLSPHHGASTTSHPAMSSSPVDESIEDSDHHSSSTRRKSMVMVTPDIAAEYHDHSSSQSAGDYSSNPIGPSAYPFDNGSLNLFHSGRSTETLKKEGSPNGFSGGEVNLNELEVSFHELGGRGSNNPLSQMKVARSSRGWHCPHCPHVATTKGNLKTHMHSGRHKAVEKPFQCSFCQRFYSTKQSLGVHVSNNHRHERSRLFSPKISECTSLSHNTLSSEKNEIKEDYVTTPLTDQTNQ